jgi:hypothetical protein
MIKCCLYEDDVLHLEAKKEVEDLILYEIQDRPYKFFLPKEQAKEKS